ncbi:MAG: GNAT family N-acetyltransferase [Balneolaceae bacterium]|nr:MAG: GNAT family N-acetyltransferase [Balneolaceae bacterium]
MKWKIAETFRELTSRHVYDLLKLRQDVFIIEQNCIYEDIDGVDLISAHLLLYSSENELLACCRIVPAGVKLNSISIGRVVSNPDKRGMGYGRQLMEKAIDKIRKQGINQIEIEAQTYLLDFYRSFGFSETGQPYPVDGIPHIVMKLRDS